LNNSNNTLILAGDLVHSAVNGGIVVHFLEEFALNSRFDKVLIVVGNHDKKKVDGINQLAYDFYRKKSNFVIYDSAEVAFVENKKILMLPYFVGLSATGKTMSEYYSNITDYFDNDNDLIVGHFSGDDCSFFGSSDIVYNLSSLNGKICLGHIHTRNVNPNRYIGSVFAGRKNENDYSRSAWILDGEKFYEYPLPIFNEFLYVTYPDELPKSIADVPIYTILNCTSEELAHERYGDIYIRKVTKDLVEKSSLRKEDIESQIDSIKNFNLKELFLEFLSTQDFNAQIAQECIDALDTLIT
jgi:DNA repair exonuclease SbcCD nuclease subunit